MRFVKDTQTRGYYLFIFTCKCVVPTNAKAPSSTTIIKYVRKDVTVRRIFPAVLLNVWATRGNLLTSTVHMVILILHWPVRGSFCFVVSFCIYALNLLSYTYTHARMIFFKVRPAGHKYSVIWDNWFCFKRLGSTRAALAICAWKSDLSITHTVKNSFQKLRTREMSGGEIVIVSN